MQKIDTTKESEWTSLVHHQTFDQASLKELYLPLIRDLEWILTSKTTGEALRKVKGAGPGNGLEAYRRLSDWYLVLTSATLHKVRTRVMKPRIATKESEARSDSCKIR